ncbi:MAG TPA: thiamine phosphate synthase, partial [Thermoguttaceae bacterium]|nr:thiamine phosphate synthase [Thermoguttaceae bacterium]
MQYQFTPAAERAIIAAAGWAGREGGDDLQPPALLLGLLAESECRAALILAESGIDAPAVRRQWPELREVTPLVRTIPCPLPDISPDVEASLQAVCGRLADFPQPLELATEHLLLGLTAAEHDTAVWLRGHGLDPVVLAERILRRRGHESGPLPLEPLPLHADDASAAPCSTSNMVGEKGGREEAKDNDEERRITDRTPRCTPQDPDPYPPPGGGVTPVLRVLDAAANRAREGLRVVEDYARFVLDDRHLTDLCKRLRHDLTAALDRIPTEHRLAARETRADVGTVLATPAEQRRRAAAEVLTANLVRLEEGLRSLEEFGKLIDPEMAAELKQLRYRSYTLQRAVEITRSSLKRLEHARLYVLMDGRSSEDEFRRSASSLIEAGVHVLQLRDKRLDDRTLLERARLLRELTAGSDTLLVINDRADLA